MSKLSPAAQAVLNALLEAKFGKEAVELGFPVMSVILGRELAAALRAAAEIVAPLSYEDVWTDGRILQYEKRDPVREKLLAIADELEAQ
jgi:hypothetical protein